MVLLRGLFGARLSYVPTVLNIIQMLGWGAFELWVIAKGAQAIFGDAVPYAVWVIVAGVLTTALTIRPLGAIRLLRRYVTVGVIISMVWLAVALVARGARRSAAGPGTAFAPAVDYVIALSVSWVPVAADYARHSRSGAAAFTGVVGGYTIAQVACLALGIVALALVGNDDGRVWSVFVAAPLGALFFGILVLREADQSFANVYSTAMSLQNLMPRVDRRLFSVAIGVLTTLIALVVDVNSYGAFLSVIGAVFVPMFAVLVVDYFVLGGKARWDTSESAPSRWRMVPPWLLGFATWWHPRRPARGLAGGTRSGSAAREAVGFTPPPWMSAARRRVPRVARWSPGDRRGPAPPRPRPGRRGLVLGGGPAWPRPGRPGPPPSRRPAVRVAGSADGDALEREQVALGLRAAGVRAGPAVALDRPVARHDQADRVRRQGVGDRAQRLRAADAGGELARGWSPSRTARRASSAARSGRRAWRAAGRRPR